MNWSCMTSRIWFNFQFKTLKLKSAMIYPKQPRHKYPGFSSGLTVADVGRLGRRTPRGQAGPAEGVPGYTQDRNQTWATGSESRVCLGYRERADIDRVFGILRKEGRRSLVFACDLGSCWGTRPGVRVRTGTQEPLRTRTRCRCPPQVTYSLDLGVWAPRCLEYTHGGFIRSFSSSPSLEVI